MIPESLGAKLDRSHAAGFDGQGDVGFLPPARVGVGRPYAITIDSDPKCDQVVVGDAGPVTDAISEAQTQIPSVCGDCQTERDDTLAPDGRMREKRGPFDSAGHGQPWMGVETRRVRCAGGHAGGWKQIDELGPPNARIPFCIGVLSLPALPGEKLDEGAGARQIFGAQYAQTGDKGVKGRGVQGGWIIA